VKVIIIQDPYSAKQVSKQEWYLKGKKKRNERTARKPLAVKW